MGCLSRVGEIVKRAALIEERCVRRIDIFRGVAVAHHASTETDDTAAPVADRENHPVTKKRIGRSTVIGPAQQATLQQ